MTHDDKVVAKIRELQRLAKGIDTLTPVERGTVADSCDQAAAVASFHARWASARRRRRVARRHCHVSEFVEAEIRSGGEGHAAALAVAQVCNASARKWRSVFLEIR